MQNARKTVCSLVVAMATWTGCARHNMFHSSSVAVTPTQAGKASYQYKPSPELLQARIQIRQAGLPLEPRELNQPLPPPEQNAAPIYKQLTQLLTTHPLTQQDTILNNVNGRRMPSDSQCEQIRRALQHRQDVVRLIHQAAQRPQCVFNRDFSLGIDLTFPELAKMRESVRILSAETTLMLHDGKPLAAIQNEELGFQVAQHAAQDPFLIAHLVGLALDAITLTWMEKCLYVSEDKPETVQAVRSAIEGKYKPHKLSYAFHGELITITGVLDKLRREGPEAFKKYDDNSDKSDSKQKADIKATVWQRPPNWEAQIDANEADWLQRMQRVIQAADLPHVESGPLLNRLGKEAEKNSNDPNHFYSATLTPVYAQSTAKQAQLQAKRDAVLCAASILIWKKQHGEFPQRLDQALSPVPVDAFNDRPFGYRRNSNGFVVYSVGNSGKFDGGSPERKPDSFETVFWYPIPAYYKQ